MVKELTATKADHQCKLGDKLKNSFMIITDILRGKYLYFSIPGIIAWHWQESTEYRKVLVQDKVQQHAFVLEKRKLLLYLFLRPPRSYIFM